ncbi:MAG: hypothetical protein ACT4PY_03220 [Armatimonadota bacterium]
MTTLRIVLIACCLGALLGGTPHGAAVVAAPGEGGGGIDEPKPGTNPLGDALIVAGQRVGPARLSMTVDQITAAIGIRPKRDEFPPDGIILYEWRAEGLWVSVSMASKAVRVISAFGTSDKYRTEKGVSLLHPRGKMEAVYGKAYKEYTYTQDEITLVRYHDLGLQFGLVNKPSQGPIHNRIFQIGVFKPGDLAPVRRPTR